MKVTNQTLKLGSRRTSFGEAPGGRTAARTTVPSMNAWYHHSPPKTIGEIILIAYGIKGYSIVRQAS